MSVRKPPLKNAPVVRCCRMALRYALIFVFAPVALLTAPAHAQSPVQSSGQSSAVIIMYHRFDEPKYPSTNTTLEQLDAHIAELKSGPYTVLAVEDIINKLRAGQPLPQRTVGITIDDAYRSIYAKAWPRLKEAGLPFTVFVSTAHVDQGSSNHLTWDQIREMRKGGGVSIGHHTVTHLHMPKVGLERNMLEIRNASGRFKKELGGIPALFAYPYGETSLQISSAIEKSGFRAAFGQHSGAIGSIGDYYYLPRFAMNEKYGDIARFRMAINALSLPVTDVTPAGHLIGKRNPPAIGFTLKHKMSGLDGLACFTSHGGKAKLERLGPVRFEVRVKKPFPLGRSRLNCTIRASGNRWHWLGRQFLKLNEVR
jgi:poly-beta-1,6-N-acetyl-D-glucosamine N-deacetylase